MRKFILAVIITLALIMSAPAQSVDHKVKELAHAIAMAEGYFIRGTIPNRYHNPGDITSSSRHAYPGQVGLSKRGYVIFKNSDYGWQALYDQIQRVIDGTSTRYTQSMTFRQIAKVYAEDRQWAKKVCSILGITPQTTFEEYFELAPRFTFPLPSTKEALR